MVDVKLVVVGGAPEGDEFRLDLPCILGRAREVSLPLTHPLVSRTHCELFERDGELFVRDLGSTNGTFVGRDRVEESVVRHGDLLTVGTVTFRASLASVTDLHVQVKTKAEQETSAIRRIDTEVKAHDHKLKRHKQKAK